MFLDDDDADADDDDLLMGRQTILREVLAGGWGKMFKNRYFKEVF